MGIDNHQKSDSSNFIQKADVLKLIESRLKALNQLEKVAVIADCTEQNNELAAGVNAMIQNFIYNIKTEFKNLQKNVEAL